MDVEEITVNSDMAILTQSSKETNVSFTDTNIVAGQAELFAPAETVFSSYGEDQKSLIAPVHRYDVVSMSSCTVEEDLDKYMVKTADEINSITATNVLSCFEIGRLLTQAKELLKQHGLWLKWLSQNVNMSHRNAERYMQLYRAYPNPTLVSNLGMMKVLALLEVRAERPEDFIKRTHDVNGKQKTVSEMTVRELRQVIRSEQLPKEPSDGADKNQEKVHIGINDRKEISFNIKSAQRLLMNIIGFLSLNSSPDIAEEFSDSICALNDSTHKCMELINLVPSNETL